MSRIDSRVSRGAIQIGLRQLRTKLEFPRRVADNRRAAAENEFHFQDTPMLS
jgi:hypothetical protein